MLVNLPYFHVEEEDPAVPLWRRRLHPRYWQPAGAAPGQTYDASRRRGGYRRLEHFTARLLGLPLATEPMGGLRCLRLLRLWLLRQLLQPMRWLAPARPMGVVDRLLHDAWRRGTRLVLAYSARDPGLFELAACFGVGGVRLAGLGWARQTMIEDADHVHDDRRHAGSSCGGADRSRTPGSLRPRRSQRLDPASAVHEKAPPDRSGGAASSSILGDQTE